jgi:hypothetical protein
MTNKNEIDDETVEEALYHQLLCYLQLLETNKPYLMNLTRVPGNKLLYYIQSFFFFF